MQAYLDLRQKIPDQTPKPYGFGGLCVSIVFIAIAAMFFVGIIGYCVSLVVAAHLGVLLTNNVIGDPLKAIRQNDVTAALRIGIGLGLLIYLGFILFVLQFAQKRGGKAWRTLIAWQPIAFPLNDKVLWSICAATLVYNVCAGPTLGFFFPKSISPLVIPLDHLALAMKFAGIVVVGPVAEELLFRGWIYTGLRFH